jgi:hypothetical protein
MKTAATLALLLGLALAGCNQTTAPAVMPDQAGGVAPSGGDAGEMGQAYCDKPPSDMDDMTQWEQLCAPGGRG